jgi:transposase
MLGKHNGQISIFDHMIYEKVIPENHILKKIDEVFDFTFIYNLIEENYSPIGRVSIDPLIFIKILLLEYLYNLSDVRVVERIQTDMALRWFLGIGIDDKVPDDTTISYFRIHRLNATDFEEIFNGIVNQCIELNLVKSDRFLVDSTDVAANVNYPSEKQLARRAYEKMICKVRLFDNNLGIEMLESFDLALKDAYDEEKGLSTKAYHKILKIHLETLYIKTFSELYNNSVYNEAFSLCYDLIEQCLNSSKDKIVSIVDTDARVAHKSKGNIKRGYKSHILIDEESEIILSASTTPFNVNDGLKLKELVKKTEDNFQLKPDELSADTAYGTVENRVYLSEENITSNIAFNKQNGKENKYYGKSDFEIDPNGEYIICPNGTKCDTYVLYKDKYRKNQIYRRFRITKKNCDACLLRCNCLLQKDGKFLQKSRAFYIEERYDVISNDRIRSETEAYKIAYNRRYIVERRFATMVFNHGLRRCRYIGIEGATRHITCANIVCNIMRAINILDKQKAYA